MNKRKFFSKAVAWLLIALMANPAAIAPAFARDTDIFLNTTSGVTTAEPNIMIVLDTSDSMNYFEDWHEYPGAYDSHVEYLWNDLNVIGNGAQSAYILENSNFISSGVGPVVTSITRAGNIATVTFASNHNYTNLPTVWTVNVYNATDPLYNGAFPIASIPAGNKITYVMTGTPAANAVAVGGYLLYASSHNPSPTSVYGFWGGATNAPEDRLALWNAAKTYANGTESIGMGDPGPRNVFRNYNDGSWIYWEPAASGISSRRLRSPSFNRFRGSVQTVGGPARGGVTFTAANDYRAYNKCNDSGNAPAADVAGNANATGISSQISPDGVTPYGLMPSTIFAPSSAPRNAGYYPSQQWVRWERFLNLTAGKFTNGDYTYPATSTPAAAWVPGPAVGNTLAIAAAGSGTGNANSTFSGVTEYLVNPPTNPSLSNLLRDSWPNTPGYGNVTNVGSQGLPIRTRKDNNAVNTVNAGDSRAGWGGLIADMGGFIMNTAVTAVPYTYNLVGTATGSNAVLIDVLGYYNNLDAGANASNAPFIARLGNRDQPGNQPFYQTTGVPGYYDSGSSLVSGAVGAGIYAIPLQASGNGTSSFGVQNIINIINPGTGATWAGQIATVAANSITMCQANGNPNGNCNQAAAFYTGNGAPPGFPDGSLITLNLRLVTSGGVTTTVCTRACSVSPATVVDSTDAGNTSRSYSSNTGPAVCNDSTGSSVNATGTGTAGTDCSTPPAACGNPGIGTAYTTVAYSGCQWTGRQNLYIEGIGTYYFGGICGSAAGTNATCYGIGHVLNGAPCPAAAMPTTNFGASSYQVSNRCAVAGLSNITVNGTAMAGAYLGGNGTQGCGNNTNVTSACPRPGVAGFAAPNGGAACIYGPTCNSKIVQQTSASTTTDYAVFNMTANDVSMYHDCIADNGTNGNPSSGYAKNYTDVPFGTTWAASYNTGANNAAPYSNPGSAIGGSNTNMYSVNYLNWQFGPKGPNNAPIGRKTRLQVAKDALAGIVASTNGVRFGLMVFNRTAACTSTTITINPGTNTFTTVNPGFIAAQNVTVVNAGASFANLNTSISSVAPNAVDPTLTDFTLAASAANPTTNATTTTGSTTITVAATAGFAVGQRISVAGADPTNPDGSNALVANITAVQAGPPRLVLSDSANATIPALGAAVTLAPITTTMTSNPCSGAIANDGANVARVIKRMGNGPTDLPDYNNRATLIAAINAVTAQARTPLTESLYEAYRYYSGRAPKWGTSSAVTSAAVVVSSGRDVSAICTTSGPGTGCTAVGAYASPMLNNPNTANPAGCQKNFIVLITDGGPEDDYSANADVKSLSWAGPLGVISPRTGLDGNQIDTASDQFEINPPAPAPGPHIPFGPQDLAGNTFDNGYIWLDELTYFMGNADVSPLARNIPGDSGTDTITGRQSVNTYTIGFAGANSSVLQNAAVRGNGVYYTADNSSALSAAIISALAAITNWNPTVAAPTVPISALNRSENATDVYLAFFQPDPSSEWLGTVKKFQLSQFPSNGDATICGAGVGLCLIGQTSLTKLAPNQSPTKNIETIVVDVITGITQSQVDDNASSFWAPSSVTDGSKPNSGGTGYQLINNTGTLTPDTRNVYTFLTNAPALQDANSGTVVDLTNSVNRVHFSNPTKISKCRLGDAAACSGTATMTDAVQETDINWIRGGDIGSTPACIDGNASTCTVWRGWPHADVQHSKPAIVTYQITPSVIQYMYYLQNNGLLTAIDTATGIEKWSFMVEEALPQIQSMINDNAGPEINVADGTPAIYVLDNNGDGNITGADKVYLFFGQRRGGRSLYAIDITQPDSPAFMWKIDANTTPAKLCVGTGSCSNAPQFNEMGQTWSTPFIGNVRANANPVLIFGGGYDPADDAQPPGARTMGRAVFVIDAIDAHIVQSWGVGQSGPFLGAGSASMIYAIPSDVTALNTDLDSQGFLDRILVGDTWGNLWRMDIDSASVSNWNAKLLATLSSDIASGERRKILFPPAVVKQNTPYRFDAVYVGTGDREHPLCLVSNQVTPTVMTNTCAQFAPADRMYMVVDTDYGLVASNASPVLVSDLYAYATTDLTTNTSNTILNSYKGWYRSLDNGEKVVNAPTVFAERLRFGTYAPLGTSGGACVPPGEGRLNEIDAITGDLVPINGSVTQASDRYYSTFITHGYISSGQLIVQGKNIFHIVVSDSRLQSVLVGSLGSATKIYWYMEPEQ